MQTNPRAAGVPPTFNLQGVPTDRHTSPLARLERSVMACLLWEDNFYESGVAIADRIQALVSECPPEAVASLAIRARTEMRLRSVPLLLAASLTRLRWKGVADLLPAIIQRADELTEFLAVWSKIDKRSGAKKLGRLPHAVSRGLSAALRKFDEPSLARNLAESREIKLRDLIRLVHPKPDSEAQAALWKSVLSGTLAFPDTWQTRLSAGGDKLAAWTDLLSSNKLGALDILKNLRNMADAGVEAGLIREKLLRVCHKVDLPFRYISAARATPQWEGWLEDAMLAAMKDQPKLSGRTVLLIDVSGSMDDRLSRDHKPGSDPMTRLDAACALAILLREVCHEVAILTFSRRVVQVPHRRGMALRDAIYTSQDHGGTDLGGAIQTLKGNAIDRFICITDEESQTEVGHPPAPKSYMVNVASTQRGVGLGPWTRITGFSESIISYIQAFEQ